MLRQLKPFEVVRCATELCSEHNFYFLFLIFINSVSVNLAAFSSIAADLSIFEADNPIPFANPHSISSTPEVYPGLTPNICLRFSAFYDSLPTEDPFIIVEATANNDSNP